MDESKGAIVRCDSAELSTAHGLLPDETALRRHSAAEHHVKRKGATEVAAW